MYTPQEVLDTVIKTGTLKVKKSFSEKMMLGFAGGGLVSLGALAYLKTLTLFADINPAAGSTIGAFLFPVGLTMILIGGGELATGNMMAVFTAFIAGEVTFMDFIKNIATILFANFLGGMFVAIVFGYGAAAVDPVTAIAFAETKTSADFLTVFLSAIGCNWLVGMAVWLNFAGKSAASRIIGLWMPTAVFVLIGFQHSVANFYFIGQSILFGGATWGQLLANAVPAIIGNIVGGAVFVGMIYYYSFRPKEEVENTEQLAEQL